MERNLLELDTLDRCPVCESKKQRLYKKSNIETKEINEADFMITDSGYGKVWDLSYCEDCSHVFANPCPRPQLVKSLYSRIVDPDYEEEASGRGKNFTRILSCLNKIHKESGKIFDIGAATGILLDLAQKKGWQPDGIEPSEWAVKIAKEKYGLDIKQGDFEGADIASKSCRVVTMVDFIEHIALPIQAVSKAYEILENSGTLCIVTPNRNSLAARLTGNKWWHYRPAHLAYFSKKSLIQLLNRAGFRIIKIRKYSWTFSLYYILSRKSFFHFLLKNKRLASFWKKIPIKLALLDSFEVYARKEQKE